MNNPETMKSGLIKAIEQLDVHDHLCLIYDSREEQLAATIPFIKMGLKRNEQCVYIVDENTAQTVLDAMRAEGVDADSAVESGALKVITKREAYLREGYFDPDLMIQFLKEAVNSAKKAGFKALRATGEMTWALGSEAGVERLIEYEAKLNYFIPENDILAVCQYNCNRFKPEIILGVIRTHPLVIHGFTVCKNFYYVPPDEFLKPKDQQLSMEVERLLKNITERKRAEEALRESEEKYRNLVERSNDGILIIQDGLVKFVNVRMAELWGSSADELLETPIIRHIHPDELEKVMGRYQRRMTNEDVPPIYETILLRKDGTAVHIEINAGVIRYKGKPADLVMIRDITERKRAEEQILQQREFLKNIFESLTHPFYVIDASDHTIIMANPAARLGRITENSKCYIITHGRDKPCSGEHTCPLDEVKKTKKPATVEHIHYDKYGNARNIEVHGYPIFDNKGNVVQMIEYCLDITEHKKAEKEINLLASIVKNIPESVCTIDLNWNILTWNDGAEKMLGYKKEEIIGKPITIIIPEELAQKELDHCLGVLNAEGFFTDYESVRLTKDGRIIPVEITAVALKDEKQNITGYTSIIRDITERKKAEELRLENVYLEAADKAKSEFLANMSHELRTPLNAAIGFSELMKQGTAGKLNEKQDHYIDNIITSSKFLLNLINDILDLSKIEAGKIELAPEKMSMPVTIKETLSLIKEKAMKHKVLLKTEFDPELDIIEADKQRFKQILFNLLSNAVKFSKEEGGTVTIRSKKEGDMAKVSISDTGIGIKEENISKLFQKFEQLESRISKKYGGTGLGLVISKQLVELHGGEIRAESKYGEGSTFTFLIPIVSKKTEGK